MLMKLAQSVCQVRNWVTWGQKLGRQVKSKENIVKEFPFFKQSSWILLKMFVLPASVAHLDALSDWRPGARGFSPRQGRQHSFVEIDHEIFSTVILSFRWFKKGSCQFLAKEFAQYWSTS